MSNNVCVYIKDLSAEGRKASARAQSGYARALLACSLKLGFGLNGYSLSKEKGGRPVLTGRRDIWVSLSHCHQGCAAACAGRRVGVDIEFIRPYNHKVAQRILSPGESIRCDDDFYRLWTLKEAFVKCTGEGLARPLSSVGFKLDGLESSVKGYSFSQFVIGGTVVSVCLEGETDAPALYVFC